MSRKTVKLNDKLASIMADIEREKELRASDMPTEEEAMAVMTSAYLRLKELGWKSSIYCPKHGERSMYLECGCSRPAPGHYLGEWPNGGWFIEDAGDLWPSMPVLFRDLREGEG